MEPIFQHRRTSRKQGAITLLVIPPFFVAWVFSFHLFYHAGEWNAPVFYWLFAGGSISSAGFGILWALWNIHVDREFIFTIYADRVECISPHRSLGANFTVALKDIISIRDTSVVDGPAVWEIFDRHGSHFEIVYTYGNPREKVISILRHLNPEIKS